MFVATMLCDGALWHRLPPPPRWEALLAASTLRAKAAAVSTQLTAELHFEILCTFLGAAKVVAPLSASTQLPLPGELVTIGATGAQFLLCAPITECRWHAHAGSVHGREYGSVSYTHLTLPTIYSV